MICQCRQNHKFNCNYAVLEFLREMKNPKLATLYRFQILIEVPKDIDDVDEVVEDEDSFLTSTTLVGDDSKEGDVGGGEHG